MTAEIVLDASAVSAFLRSEPGGEAVLSHVGSAAISAVNLQEVFEELALDGMSAEEAAEVIGELRLDVRPRDEVAARAAGMLVLQTRRYGRGLGDRTCMALGIAMGSPVLTADGEWRRVAVEGLRLEHIR